MKSEDARFEEGYIVVVCEVCAIDAVALTSTAERRQFSKDIHL